MSILKWGSSPQHCGADRSFSLKKLFGIISTVVTITLVVILILYFVLRTSNPEVFLRDVNVGNLAVLPSYPPLLNSSLLVSFNFKNPNPRFGVQFASMFAYATFMEQPITGDTQLPSFHLAPKGGFLQPAVLSGAEMQLAPTVANELLRGQSAPWSQLSFALEGKLRSGLWGLRRFDVACPAFVALQPGSGGLARRPPQCSLSL